MSAWLRRTLLWFRDRVRWIRDRAYEKDDEFKPEGRMVSQQEEEENLLLFVHNSQ